MNRITILNWQVKPRKAALLHPKLVAACRSALGLAGFLFALVCPAQAERVTEAEARTAAQDWVAVITHIHGQWGGSPQAQVDAVRPLKQGERVVGYFCSVQPGGYVVVSLYKELTPVRAYATNGGLDPDADFGMSDFIKTKLELVLERLERVIGPLDQVHSAQSLSALKTDPRPTWSVLHETATAANQRSRSSAKGPPPLVRLAGGRVLLATSWHQYYPYNAQSPTLVCSGVSKLGYVGCVPLGASQLMRHWCWPPYGSQAQDGPYDWTQMPDWFGSLFSSSQVTNVARLCRDAGKACDANYQCDRTSAFDSCWWAGCRSMEDAFKDTFRYSLTSTHDVDAVNGEEWFQGVKDELERNQPMAYALVADKHSVVLDGWQDIQMGDPPTVIHQYHVNYGWGGRDTWGTDNTGWFTQDGIPGYSHDKDYRLANTIPDHSLGSLLVGSVPNDLGFPYHYVNVNALALGSVQFSAGALVQFLPGTKIIAAGPVGQVLAFAGQTNQQTRIFAYSDNGDGSMGIVLANGALKLSNGGGVTLSPLVPPRILCGYGTNGPGGVGSIFLSWESGYTGDDAVVVERQNPLSPIWVAIASLNEPITGLTDTNVLSGLDYTYRVRAVGGGRSSAPTPAITLSTP